MRSRSQLAKPALVLAMALLLASASARAQDNITIPKSRLEELERKEKELERLKGVQDKAAKTTQPVQTDKKAAAEPALPSTAQPQPPGPSSPVQPPPGPSSPVHSPPIEPVVSYVSPPMDSLPPFQPYELVDSMDLANYYHADVQWSDNRFRKQKLSVRGEIVAFEKPLWNRTYQVILKTPAHEARVICDLLPPDKANAVYTINHGEQLVALMGQTQVPIARVGQNVVVKGECKGLSGSVIMVMARELKPAP